MARWNYLVLGSFVFVCLWDLIALTGAVSHAPPGAWGFVAGAAMTAYVTEVLRTRDRSQRAGW